MEFRLLGQLEVDRDGVPVDVGPRRQRALLALLLLNRGHIVSTDRILDELWGDNAADKQNALWVHLSKLRSALEPDRPKRSEGTIILTRSPGYLVDLNSHTVDIDRFEASVERGSELVTADPAAAVAAFDEALGLWRGAPYEDFAFDHFADGETSRLEELRLVVLERRAEAQLRLGQATDIVVDLERLVHEHPIREGLTRYLMVALHRSGRQADALRAYERLRAQLAEETGLEPSPDLRDLEARILRRDSELTRPTPDAPATLRSYEIGERLGEGSFSVVHCGRQPAVGRDVAVKVIRAELANDPRFVRRFEAEAQLVARLEHPHIVPLYDYWREPDAAYLVMRILRGGTLHSRLVDAPLSVDETVRMVEQVGGALAFAHERGVVHRDVKPANIFVDDDSQFYLGDFGIAVDIGTGPDPVAALSVGSPAYASPEQLASEPVGPAADVFAFAITVFEALAGRLPFHSARSQAELIHLQMTESFPRLSGIVDGLPPQVDDVVDRATAKHAGERFADVTSFIDAFLAALQGPAPAGSSVVGRLTLVTGPLDCPYVGLVAFDEADAGRFHGRDRLVGELVDRLGSSRMVTVVGPSGSGKSSVVRAGLVPAVRNGALPRSDDWYVITTTPGVDPYEELEAALLRIAVNPPASLREQLVSDDRGIARAVRRVLPADGSELLLVLDQFEELFTLCDDEELRRSFLRALVTAVTDDRSGLRVVATCRADFYDRPLRQPELAQLMRDATVPVTPLAPDELERAIVDPAARLGVEFEPGLVSAIVAAVNDQPGALPLLQFTLTRLWESRSDGVLTMAAYGRLGGVSGALAAEAEALFSDLDAAQQSACRSVFSRLVTPGEGRGDTRRRADRAEIEAIEHGDDIVDRFGAARLLAFDRDRETRHPTVEVAHEALLWEWPRLGAWIDEDRTSMRTHRRISQASASWNAGGRDASELLRGGRLEEAAEYATSADLLPVEADFVAAGVAERDRVTQVERRRVRRLRALLTASALVAAIAITAGAVAFVEQQRADDAARDADAARVAGEIRRMAADAPRLAETDARLGLLIAVEAYRRDPGPLTLGALQRVFLEAGGFVGALGAGSDYQQAVWSPNGHRIAAVGENTIDVFELETFELVDSISVPHADLVVYGPNGELAAVSESRRVLTIDPDTGAVLADATANSRVTALAFVDGDRLAVGTERGELSLHRVDGGDEIWRIVAHPETVEELRVSGEIEAPDAHQPLGFELGVRGIDVADDGTRLVTTGAVFARFWDVESGDRIDELEVGRQDDPSAASDVAFLDDDRIATMVRADRAFQVHDLSSRTSTDHPVQMSATASAVADAGTVAAVFTDELAFVTELDQVVVISLDTGETVATIELQSKSAIANLAVSPDGSHVAAAGPDGVVVHAVNGSGMIATAAATDVGPSGINFGAGGRQLGLGNSDADRTTRTELWQLDGVRPQRVWAGGTGRVFLDVPGVALVQDKSARLAAVTIDELAAGSSLPEPFAVHNNYSQDYDPRQQLIALGGGEPDVADIHLYDATTFEPARAPLTALTEQGARFVVSLSFSPDGSRLAAASFEGVAYVLDTATWEPLVRLASGAGAVVAVEYSPDGRFLATSSATGEITIRDAITSQPIGAPLIGSVGGRRFAGTQPLAFSPDGNLLLSTIDGAGRLWDLRTRTQIGTAFETNTGANMAPSSDAGRLAISDGARLVVYDLDVDRWSDIACRAAGRNLTATEWAQFGPAGEVHEATCPRWPLDEGST